jgi:signal peptidase I
VRHRADSRLPHGVRVAIDWLATIVLALGVVLAFEAEVAKPFRIPSSSMEPTLHCAKPARGCLAHFSDRVIAARIVYRFRSPHRGELVVFRTPPATKRACGVGGTFVKRIIGLPGEVVSEVDGTVYIDGRRLDEPYVPAAERTTETQSWPRVPRGQYFLMGDNRSDSCDSRSWGAVPRANLIGPVFATYWPPQRIGLP